MMGDLSNTIIDGDPFDINEGGEGGGGFDPTSLSLSTQTPVAADEIITGESGGTWVRKTLAKMKEYFTGATYNVQATADKAHMDLTEDGTVKTTLPVPMTFVGTQNAWNNLSAAEQANYRIVNITDDFSDVVNRSYVGMVIHSTTLDTEAKVKSFYGGTTWIQHSGYFLRGATSSVTANSAAKDGGEDTVTLTVDQIPAHNHPMANNGRPITIGTNYDQIAYNEGFQHSNGNWWGNNHKGESDIGYRGGSKAHNNVPNYKNVYIWERTL